MNNPNMQPEGASPHDDAPIFGEIHLRDYVHLVLSRWPLALCVWLAIVLLTAVYTWTRTPLYEAASRILVRSSEVNLTDMKGASEEALTVTGQREFLQTQVQLITSRPVMEATLVSAGLLQQPEFQRASDPVATLARRLKAIPVRNTRIIEISVQDANPRLAANTVNAAVDAFLNENRSRRLGISTEGLQDLHRKQEELRVKLDAASEALQAFMVEHDIVSFERIQNVVIDTLMALNRELTTKEPRRLELQARVEAARQALARGQPVESLPDVMNAVVVQAIRLDQFKLEKEYAQLIERLGSEHPQLQSLRTQIETLRTKIAMEASAILQAVEMEYAQAQREAELLRARIREQQDEVFKFNELAAQYNILKQDQDSIETTYLTIVRRIQEIDSSRIGAQGENIFVIERATPPVTHDWPSRGRNMLVALLLGAAAAVALCFFIDYMDITIKSDEDIKHLLQLPVLADIPGRTPGEEPGAHPDCVVSELPLSQTAESFRGLRTALSRMHGGQQLHALVVSSTLPSDGKTFVAVNLAIAQASINRRTLLIDADMRKPRLHHVFPGLTTHGLADLLSPDTAASFETAMLPTAIENLWFMPCGRLPQNPAELLESPRFARIVAELKLQFDCLVFDSPPGLSLVDSTVIAKEVDGIIVVVRNAVTAKAPARQFVEALRQSRVTVLGVALNNVDVPTQRYGYRYGRYRYSYAYREQRPGSPANHTAMARLRASLAARLGRPRPPSSATKTPAPPRT